MLQLPYSVRSERLLMERLDHDLLFRWFVGLDIDTAVWDPSTFSQNRDKLVQSGPPALLVDLTGAAAPA